MAAAAAALLDSKHQRILIAVRADLHDLLKLTAGGPFVPERLPAAAPVNGLPQLQRHAQRFLVHVGQHQRGVRVCIHRHRSDEAMLIKFGRKLQAFFDSFFRISWGKSDHGAAMLAARSQNANAAQSR